jgi:hypothetical protein
LAVVGVGVEQIESYTSNISIRILQFIRSVIKSSTVGTLAKGARNTAIRV